MPLGNRYRGTSNNRDLTAFPNDKPTMIREHTTDSNFQNPQMRDTLLLPPSVYTRKLEPRENQQADLHLVNGKVSSQ